MLISAFAALVLFAAPEAAQGGAAPAPAAEATAPAEAKPAMRKECVTVEVAGSNLPKRKCKMVPVKAEPAKVAEDASAKATTSE